MNTIPQAARPLHKLTAGPGPWRPQKAWWRLGVMICATLLLLVGAGQAAEFATPPGINVERQEEQLKSEVLRQAKDLVGPGLIDVIVNVTYVRRQQGQQGQQGEKIKLPGFDRVITLGADDKLGIEAEYLRMRQITVIVADSLKSDTARIEQELNSAGKFVRANGDILKVTTLADSGAGQKNGLEKGGQQKKGGEPFARKSRRRSRGTGPPTNEPESTVHLLRARTAYFKEDYNRALDHILNAIEVEPRSAMAYSMLGSLYFTINWKNLAVKYWEVSLDLDPGNWELQELVANIKNSN
jgi:tetratricopeptide (TPR) repeat protein